MNANPIMNNKNHDQNDATHKTLKIYIGNANDALQTFMHVWESGQAADPVHQLSFESMQGFMRAFTPKRWELLDVLKRSGHQNINQLAKRLTRDYKNVHTDVQLLKEFGVLEKDSNGLIFVPWDEIETHFKLGLAA